MRHLGPLGATIVLAGVTSSWVLATEHQAAPPHGVYAPREPAACPVSAARAADLRRDALATRAGSTRHA
jgi:hypothetical protein